MTWQLTHSKTQLYVTSSFLWSLQQFWASLLSGNHGDRGDEAMNIDKVSVKMFICGPVK